METKFGLSGHLKLENSRTGEVRDIPNTIMNVGKSSLASMLGSDVTSTVAFDYMSVGISGIAAVATQTALGSEQVRVLTTSTQTTSGVTNDTATFIGSFGVSGTHSIVEAGIFNAASAGSMLARTTFSALSVISGDFINGTWNVTVA